MTMRILVIIFFLSCFSVWADDEDSTRVPLPPVIDTSGFKVDDTLSDAQKMLARFEERQKKFKEEEKPQLPLLSYSDSLILYFISSRQNKRAQVDRSFYHDAGDYFRSDPSYFIIDQQVTPLRKTIQPFGLTGDRLNFITYGVPLKPFEHVIEPDGMRDLNDLPTALDDEIYVLSGPLGQFLGGDNATASLVTLPKKPDTQSPETAILHDRGSYAYNYTRGNYSKIFNNNRSIDMSIGYRNADGIGSFRDDDMYQYFGNFYFPLNQSVAVRAWGQLYDRGGTYYVRPADNGNYVYRDKFDRNLRLSADLHNEDHTEKYEIGYRHLRQSSYLSNKYKAWYHMTGNGLFASREWSSGNSVFQANLNTDYTIFDDGAVEHDRIQSDLSLSMARLWSDWRYALTVSGRYVKDYDLLASAAVVFYRETDKMLLTLSFGYSEKAPTLYELNLPFQRATIYSGTSDYANVGNDSLETEKQLVGNITFEYGSLDNSFSVNVTGGKIFDGIDWQNVLQSDSIGEYTLFYPMNGDIDFINVTVGPEFGITDFLKFNAGVSYHYIDYENFDDKPYLPDYQVFSGLGLHHYWAKKLMHLFAYGEIVYTSRYHGYKEENLGEDLIANAKLSFSLKKFHFHYVFQNILNTEFRSREYITFSGRYNYFGITWNFLD